MGGDLAVGFLRMTALTAGVCAGQVPPSHYIEINLPPGVASEGVLFATFSPERNSEAQPRSGLSSYIIGTMVGALPATQSKQSFTLSAAPSRPSMFGFRVQGTKNNPSFAGLSGMSGLPAD